MPSPFPGMDPYLERPSLWPGLHVALMGRIQAALNPRLLPNYIAQIETRVYVLRDDDPARRQYVGDVSVERPVRRARRRQETESAVQLAEPEVFSSTIDIEVEEARIEIRDRRRNTLVAVIEVLSPTNKVPNSEGRRMLLGKRREIMAAAVHWIDIDLLRDGEPSQYPPRDTDYGVYS